MVEKQAVIVLSGYNIRAVIAFCRWATTHHVNYHIIATEKSDPIFSTIYKEKVEFIRDSKDLRVEDFLSWIDKISKRYGYHQILVLPSTEYLNRFLLENRGIIEAVGCSLPLVGKHLYETISDKEKFARLCDSYGLDIPREFNGIPEKLPFVAKPRTYSSGIQKQLHPHLIMTKHDLDQFLKGEKARNYFFQEYIHGRSLYLLACIQHDGGAVLFSQENLMQQFGGKSIILAKTSSFHRSNIAKVYIDMWREIKFFGFIMVEVRLEMSLEKYFMIEANPRLWGPLQFTVDNNIDLFGTLLRDYGFDVPVYGVPKVQSEHYFWSGGITSEAQPITFHNYSGEQFIREFPALRRNDIFLRGDTIGLFLNEAGLVENSYELPAVS